MTVHRLGGMDATLVAMETPSQPLHMFSIAELDVSALPGGYRFETFRDTLRARTDALPEFRAKVADHPLNLDAPAWVEDPDFDIHHHVHRLELPAPGGRDELRAVAERLASTMMDRSRPLWGIWIVEGLDGVGPDVSGRVAMIVLTHHAFADGVTAGDLWSQLHAVDADAPAPERVEGFGTPGPARIALTGLARVAARPWTLLTRVLPVLAAVLARAVRSAVRGGLPRPAPVPVTPFDGPADSGQGVAWTRLDLEAVSTVKNAYGVDFNDVVLAVFSGALRRFLASRGALPDAELRAVSVLSDHDETLASRNQLFPVFFRLHSDIADPAERLRAIATSGATVRSRGSLLPGTVTDQLVQCLPAAMVRVPMQLFHRSGMSARMPITNLVFASVRGGQQHVLGAPIIVNYPYGPVLHGVHLNITAASLGGTVAIGIRSLRNLGPDLWDLADCMPDALQELLDVRTEAA